MVATVPPKMVSGMIRPLQIQATEDKQDENSSSFAPCAERAAGSIQDNWGTFGRRD